MHGIDSRINKFLKYCAVLLVPSVAIIRLWKVVLYVEYLPGFPWMPLFVFATYRFRRILVLNSDV